MDFVRPYPRYRSENTQKTSYYEFHFLATKHFFALLAVFLASFTETHA